MKFRFGKEENGYDDTINFVIINSVFQGRARWNGYLRALALSRGEATHLAILYPQ